jgi:type II secretory pathway pseudopilin PulG
MLLAVLRKEHTGWSRLLRPPAQIGFASLRRAARREEGITLVESIFAVVLFAVVAAALANVLVSAINAKAISRDRTVAQEAVMAEIEAVRRLPYDSVGVTSGNPPGVLQATKTVIDSGVPLTVTIAVSFVNDPLPTSYVTGANYKKVTVTVSNSDGKQLIKETTYVAPPARAPFGGINLGIVNVQVVDYANNTPVEGATVGLTLGPSAPRSDATDNAGSVTFPALTPNPSGASFYDISVSKAGYVVLADDLSPATAAHVSLSPSQTFNTAIRIYLPATINVKLDDGDGADWTGPASVTVSSSRGSETFVITGDSLTLTDVDGEPIVPSLEYTVSASSGFLSTPAVIQYVPDDYPSDLESDFLLTFPDAGSFQLTVYQLGAPKAGVTVTLTGGPGGITATGTTDVNGVITFSGIPAGAGYVATATLGAQSAMLDVTVPDDDVGMGSGTITLPDPPPPGTVVGTITWAGFAVSGATVTLTGGPFGVNVSGTADASGLITFTNVPAGSGYTISATRNGQSASQAITVASAASTNVTLALPVATLTVTVRRSGTPQVGATVQVTGGPMGLSFSGTTVAGGVVTFTNVPVGSGYSFVAFRCPLTGNDRGTATATVNAPTTAVTVNFTTNTC